MNAFTTLSLTVFTQINFVTDFLQMKCEFTPKTAVLRFWAWKRPFCVFEPQCGLGTTYDDYFKLIGKHEVDFLLVLIELCSLGLTAEALRANIGKKISDFAPTGAGWPKISGRRGRPYQPFLFSENWAKMIFRMVWKSGHFSSVLSQFTRLTDGQTAFSWLYRPAFSVAQ